MSKLSTLYKAHIFLILFLLSVCNPMYVAGAAALGVTLPTTGLAATPGVKLSATGREVTPDVRNLLLNRKNNLSAIGQAATPVPVPRTPSKSAAPLTLPSSWNWDNMKTFARVFGISMGVTMLAVICLFALFYLQRVLYYQFIGKTSNGKNDTHNHVRIFYGSVLLVSFVLITLMLIYFL